MDDREKAFEMFGEGRSVNRVASDLFKGNWTKTKKLHVEWAEANGGGRAAASRRPRAESYRKR